jgi:hypothetical protein
VSFQLNLNSDPQESFMTIGGVDSKAFEGQMVYHHVVRDLDQWWTIDYKGIKF